MKGIIRRFIIGWNMRAAHRWSNVGNAAVQIARELGEEYEPERPKRKPGKLLPETKPFYGKCYLYEDDAIRIDVKVSFNLVMFSSLPHINVQAWLSGQWVSVFECGAQTCERYQYGEWVKWLYALKRDLDSKEHRAQQARFMPLERGGPVDPGEYVYIDESPRSELIMPANGRYVTKDRA